MTKRFMNLDLEQGWYRRGESTNRRDRSSINVEYIQANKQTIRCIVVRVYATDLSRPLVPSSGAAEGCAKLLCSFYMWVP